MIRKIIAKGLVQQRLKVYFVRSLNCKKFLCKNAIIQFGWKLQSKTPLHAHRERDCEGSLAETFKGRFMKKKMSELHTYCSTKTYCKPSVQLL